MSEQAKKGNEFVSELPNAKLRIWMDGGAWSGFAVIHDPASGRNRVIYFSCETEESVKIQALKLASGEAAEWRPARLSYSPLMQVARAAAAGAFFTGSDDSASGLLRPGCGVQDPHADPT